MPMGFEQKKSCWLFYFHVCLRPLHDFPPRKETNVQCNVQCFSLIKNATCKKEICVVIHVIYELNWLLWVFFRMDFLKHLNLFFFLTELKMKPQKPSESEIMYQFQGFQGCTTVHLWCWSPLIPRYHPKYDSRFWEFQPALLVYQSVIYKVCIRMLPLPVKWRRLSGSHTKIDVSPDTGGKTAPNPKDMYAWSWWKKNPRIVYIEELISFIDQLVPAENLKLLDSWDLISEEAANAVAEVLLQVPATPNGFCEQKRHGWCGWKIIVPRTRNSEFQSENPEKWC